MDSNVKTNYEQPSKFLSIDQISTVFKILQNNILSNKKLVDNGIFSNGFLLNLTNHNDAHKVDVKLVMEEQNFNFKVDENNNLNIKGYPRGNFIFLFTHNFLTCLKAKKFAFKYYPTPIFKVSEI